jgi:dihydrofolate reductase
VRRVVVPISVSLDGFFEGVDRDISWHHVDEELHQHFNDELRAMGGFLSGRVTWDLMSAYWPTADDDPDAPEPVREFAGIWRETPKLVFSRTLQEAGWNAEIRREVDPDEIRRLKAEPGGDLALGGASLAAAFRAHDLVDEWRLYVNPLLLGRGNRVFADADARTDLRLAETRTFGNGVVMLRYERTNAAFSSP